MNTRAAIRAGVKARDLFGLSAETVMSEIPSLFSLWRSELRPIEGRRSDQVTYAEAGAGLAVGADGSSCSSSRGSHWSHLGRYQFRSPSSFIVAGSSTPRTSVASIKIAAASPTPNCLNISIDNVAK